MKKAKIYYARMDEFWRKEEKLDYLEKLQHIGNVEWQEIKPDKKQNWLTGELEDDFEAFIPLGTKETKSAKGDVSDCIFKLFSNGVKTNRDVWAYNFSPGEISANIQRMIDTYNEQLIQWKQKGDKSLNIDDFLTCDDTKISWSGDLKEHLNKGVIIQYNSDRLRLSIYRPFTVFWLYFDRYLNNRRYQFPSIFPTPKSEQDNWVICLSSIGNHKPFHCLMVRYIPDLHLTGDSQCFPFYTYDEDGTNRQENITDWALEQFRNQYKDTQITKWDIFYYTYSILHHPDYRERYAANLKRELPRIPFAPEFHPFVTAGKRLAEIHINYEQQPEYHLKHIENKDLPIDWRVEKMRLSKDKTQLKYNDFLTLTGIPPEAFEYRLGNRSALDWIIDQYQVSIDKRSGITNDPNRLDDEEYIVRLIKKVITVSWETVKIVKNLPDLGLPND
ncbi:type ISP restriction/modification enzyme [Limnoraphis robusta Tam1]|uniref:Type ISP restriction/modification enzyme n=1 Tax=Limnoraphis robusta CCNP1315 TaxID=3110306 RepID=A0ABU5U7N0_9CYAN|nr:type ISP restriction/modification enzyme [Limnoraphis robusta]MEA5498552.1 type ISP restriction/modification enzyme [Limnoraphis robusta BA-68 BA1]MEA5523186.1 type ISP restriction/modification enzyme [Limnoraphis robusta CCNP1315]MEA5543021.1 type ISP restriction/modification enzyme [Limnoraphis robusta Tam1]MEA5549093.1 type ISP restriction/modification enzyme [Limnoraphis robusta CCNP1324]